jgi:hypothetical protein
MSHGILDTKNEATMRKIDPYIKHCGFCQKEFLTKDKTQKLCSRPCSIRKMADISSNNKNGKVLKCDKCDKEFYKKKCLLRKTNFCSEICRTQFFHESPKSHIFKEYEIKKPKPKYKQIRIGGKRMQQHRYLMELHLGRSLEKWEHVHHINSNPLDNRIENLQVLSNEEHGRLTRQENPRKD